jgi:hypothetical protein
MKSGKFMARGLVTERIFSLVFIGASYSLRNVFGGNDFAGAFYSGTIFRN